MYPPPPSSSPLLPPPVQLELWEVGSYDFKGLQRPYDVVQIMPTCLSARLDMVTARSTAKARLLSPASGKLCTVWVDMVNINSVMQPE